ncbi:MAG: T9SS type A sorting domain-containing protein, partial [Candidatus Marinimicrobia bacterium]|nr:T9SS type A sorting domain-containing protein [Candidatus Neomarinimicrobiota bacterium]
TIQYELPQRSDVQITIYDLLGRKVTTLISQTQDAGFKSVIWDASNSKGQPVSAGVYFYRIKVYDPDAIGAGDPSTGSGQSFVQTRKMVLLK